jgi:hypothetical protein
MICTNLKNNLRKLLERDIVIHLGLKRKLKLMLQRTFAFPFVALEFICVCPLMLLASASSTLILDLYFSSRALIRLFC